MTSLGDIKISTINVSKAIEIEKSLEYTLANFRDLIFEIKQLNNDSSHNYKSQFLTQKEKCERKSCVGAEAMKTIIESKNNIMKIVVTVLRKFYDTKNFNILDEIFELCGESSPSKNRNNIKANENCEPKMEARLPSILSPKKEVMTEDDNMMIQDESISEIEGTPTGRTSPILKSKIFRSVTSTSSPDVRDKKKCPNSWPTPETKVIKLLQNTPKRKETNKASNGRLRQSRLNLVRSERRSVVDLTRSPEFGGGARGGGGGGGEAHLGRLNIKREPSDKDETMLPPASPSGPITLVFKTTGSPKKAKKTSPVCKQIKIEEETRIDDDEGKENCPFEGGMENGTEIDASINILRGGFRLPNDVTGQAAMRLQPKCEIYDDDVTHCDTDSASLSQLMEPPAGALNDDGNQHSPKKSPLVENMNATNCAGGAGAGAGGELGTVASDHHKRKSPMKVEPLYKEPTVRKKAEKMALPGWSCEECEKFWGELYKDDPAMLAKKMALCSKHRGRQNPARPRTPPGFWNMRWSVPEDTEEFNRRNNAL